MRLVEDTGEDIEDRVDYREQARDEEVHEEVPPCRSPHVGCTTQRRVSNDDDMMKRPTCSWGYPSRETDHANRYSNASSSRPRVQFGGGQSTGGGPVLTERWQQSIIDDNASVIRSSVDPEGEQRVWDSDDIREGGRGMGCPGVLSRRPPGTYRRVCACRSQHSTEVERGHWHDGTTH